MRKFILIAVLLVLMMGQARIFFSMARDGLLPSFFSKVHPKFRTPYVTTIITGLLIALFAAFTNIEEMVDLTNIGTLFAFGQLTRLSTRHERFERVRCGRTGGIEIFISH